MARKKIEIKIKTCKFCQREIVGSYKKLIHKWNKDNNASKGWLEEIYYFCDYNCKMNWINTRGKTTTVKTSISLIGKNKEM